MIKSNAKEDKKEIINKYNQIISFFADTLD